MTQRSGFLFAWLGAALISAFAGSASAQEAVYAVHFEGVSVHSGSELEAFLEDALAEQCENKICEFSSVVTETEKSVQICPSDAAADQCPSLSAAQLNQLAMDLEAYYESEGYSLARRLNAYNDLGDVTIKMLEGRISRVDVCVRNAGDAPDDDAAADAAPMDCLENSSYHGAITALTSGLCSEDVDPTCSGTGVISNARLQGRLLLLNDLPGLEVKGILIPAMEVRREGTPEPESGDIVLQTVADRDRFDLAAVIHNRGAETTGRWQAAVIGGLNDAPVIGGRLEGLVAAAIGPSFIGDQFFGRLSYERYLGPWGTKVRLLGQAGSSLPRFSNTTIEVDTDTWRARAEVEQPIVRGRRFNAYGVVAFDVSEVNVDQFSLLQLEERVAAIELGLKADAIGFLNGVTSAEAQLRRGVAAFDATRAGAPNALRGDGSPEFYSVYGKLQRYQPLFSSVALTAVIEGQYADRALFSLEEYTAGDATLGRGFDPVEIIGDSGFGGSLELDYTRDLPAGLLPGEDGGRWRLFVFADGAAIYNRGNLPGNPKSAQIISVGGGAQITIDKKASFSIEAAAPLTRTPGTGLVAETGPRILATLRGFF